MVGRKPRTPTRARVFSNADPAEPLVLNAQRRVVVRANMCFANVVDCCALVYKRWNVVIEQIKIKMERQPTPAGVQGNLRKADNIKQLSLNNMSWCIRRSDEGRSEEEFIHIWWKGLKDGFGQVCYE
jgi:hypothetical protein